MIEIPYSQIFEDIRKRNAKLVLVQLPEGLKNRVNEISEQIEKNTNAKAIMFMDPCFGACDLADDKAKVLGCDLLIHLGHVEIYKGSIDTLFYPLSYDYEFSELEGIVDELEEMLKKKKLKSMRRFCNAQYLKFLVKLAGRLEKNGFKVSIGKGSGRIKVPGQVLGCNLTGLADVDEKAEGYVYLGDGMFHPLGMQFFSGKPVIILDPVAKEITDMAGTHEKFLRQRYALISEAMKAKKFGILLSSKKGQLQKQLALKCREMIESRGKKAYLFAMDLIKEDYMLGADVDCYVNTACNRIASDDFKLWRKPIINPKELEIALGIRKAENYEFDQLP